jgi:hypothetical protein
MAITSADLMRLPWILPIQTLQRSQLGIMAPTGFSQWEQVKDRPIFTRQESAASMRRILTRENVFAIVFCLILILLVIVTADTAPQWIYQGY